MERSICESSADVSFDDFVCLLMAGKERLFISFLCEKVFLYEMGIVTSCCRPSASDVMTPDAETRRRQQVEAAEKRAAQDAGRGVKDPEKMRKMQQRSEEIERREQELSRQGGAALKWTAD